MKENNVKKQSLREILHEVIFEAETPAGSYFDFTLLVLIVISILAVILESVQELDDRFHEVFFYTEWVLTFLFTIEYLLRIYAIQKPWKYISSFYGIIDLLAILPTYLSLLFVGSQYLLTIRAIRLLRIFRLLKLGRYVIESKILLIALRASRPKITVFLGAVFTIVLVIGSFMYLIEGGADSGFTSIPRSMYWAIVTLTTVGYGDITPVTALGQALSALLMITGYAIIAVPTGIVSVELAAAVKSQPAHTVNCPSCAKEGHDKNAQFCKFCGTKL